MEGRRPCPNHLGSNSGLQANHNLDPSERSLCRYSIDNSVGPGSSDDGIPVAPSGFLKMQDGVYPSPNPEGWSENLIEDWLTRQPWCVGSVASKGCNSAFVPSNSGLCEFSLGFFLGALGLIALYGREFDVSSGPAAAQLTVLAGLHHDRVG